MSYLSHPNFSDLFGTFRKHYKGVLFIYFNMVSRVKDEDNEFSIWTIVIAVIFGAIILYGIFGSTNNNSSNSYQPQQNTYSQPSFTTPQKAQEPEDNRLTCPAGNQADSGQKTDDWFECSDIKKMMKEKKSDKKIDCSKSENYNKEKVYFAINTICEKNGWIGVISYCEEEGGTISPIVQSQAYPSLGEYYFYSISTKFENLGCTKLNPDDYLLIYALYQNGKMLESKVDNKSIAYINGLLGEEDSKIYPEDWLMLQLGFGKQIMLPTAVQTTSPNGFTFKVCLIDSAKKTIISCDETDFNIKYKSE